MEKGDRVRFTTTVGALDPTVLYRPVFVDWKVNPGDEGVYNRHEPVGDQADWHICEVEHDGDWYEVPVHSSHFEVIEVVTQFTDEEREAVREQNAALNSFFFGS